MLRSRRRISTHNPLNERDTTHMRFDHQITQNNRVTATIWWERWVFDQGGGSPYEKDDRWYNFDLADRQVAVPSDQALRQVVPGYPVPVVTAREAGYPDKFPLL